jgi:putative tryptophan/tyrosine transport system substrate-binding protein
VQVIGYIDGGAADGPLPSGGDYVESFRDGLGRHGLAEGIDYVIEERYFENQRERIPGILTELVDLGAKVVIAMDTRVGPASKESGILVPIVLAVGSHHLEYGTIESYERPGHHVTGVVGEAVNQRSMQLELLREFAPDARLLALVHYPGRDGLGIRVAAGEVQRTTASAEQQGLRVVPVSVRSENDFTSAFMEAQKAGAEAALVLPHPLLSLYPRRLVNAANGVGIPTLYFAKRFVELGGLVSYGADRYELCRQAADHVWKILQGEDPAVIPTVRPNRMELAINRKTARQQEIDLPAILLSRATDIIV